MFVINILIITRIISFITMLLTGILLVKVKTYRIMLALYIIFVLSAIIFCLC